ncbi:anaerobic ribonucleoside-triphosphate reductase activating protein [bacterium]|nr:anaerobic ribonucleoside-triphosphate reductase activating protein [bacterium]
MLITGFEKISLVNFDSEVSATIFLAGCNFRCPFCHNFEFVIFDEDYLEHYTMEEVISYLKKRRGLLSAVVVSGGEPTINSDLEELLSKIKELGYRIKLDTNGLKGEYVISLLERGLVDYIALDIKNSLDMYPKTAGLKSLDTSGLVKLIEFLKSNDYGYEFRTTLIKNYHTKESIEEMAKLLKGGKKLFLQKFEMSDNVPDRTLEEIKKEDALEFKHILESSIMNVSLRGYD